VDQLASCIGLTLLLNKQGKHAAAVFSGTVPSTLEFLQPEETLEKNTDSLRDFIISLDKAKADKLRYKVEEDVVRIFITPYKTSLSADDLEFSEGDFNVDVVVALGVKQQEDLDEAITAHGRILHDATVTSINTTPDGALGSINWFDPQASSLSELVTNLAQALGADLLDEQIATALLTGIVAETARFSNDKTSSQTMSASAALMAAGANQQLVADKLENPGPGTAAPASAPNPEEGDGVLEIDHAPEETPEESAPAPEEPPAPPPPPTEPPAAPEPQPGPTQPPESSGPTTMLTPGPKLITEPPSLGGTLTANSQADHIDPVTDPLSMPSSEPPKLFGQDADNKRPPEAGNPPSPPPPAAASQPAPPQPVSQDDVPASGTTLTDLEKSVHSPHLNQGDLDSMRDEVNKALSDTPANEPIQALNAQPLGDDLHPQPPQAPPANDNQSDNKDNAGPDAPPPVPPPIPFQFGNSSPPK
jgi:hypothetical protein